MTPSELRELRRKKGLSQAQLAAQLWISQAHIAKIEVGKRKINHRLYMQLKQLYPEEMKDIK